MKYFIDTEFDGFGGRLLSLALVNEDPAKPELYLVVNDINHTMSDPWVQQNVVPVVHAPGGIALSAHLVEWPGLIRKYFLGDSRPHVISDWPDDIKYLMQCLITGPGRMINLKGITCEYWREEDAYPSALPGAVQHNALWDARALRKVYQEFHK